MKYEDILDIDELAALAYFIPDFKSNTGIDSLVEEIENAVRRKAIEADSLYKCCSPEAMCDMSMPLEEPCGSPCDGGGVFPVDAEFSADQLIRELGEINEDILRGIGLSEKAMKFILSLKVKPSRLKITRHSRIILEDYDKTEIKLDDKTKALYFLFLRHPEGIAIKGLQEHVNELMDLYQSISGRDDPDAMKRTIMDLVSPFGNSVNISLSRIKRAFGELYCKQIAQNYYVTGERGEERKITLDRELVTWETIR